MLKGVPAKICIKLQIGREILRNEEYLLEIDGYTLQAESFQAILRILFVVRDIFKYFAGGAKKEIYPKLFDLIRPLSFDEGLIKSINAVFDDKGDIRADASPGAGLA